MNIVAAVSKKFHRENFELSNREMQCIGAICIRDFCSNFGIQHVAIEKLVEHLLAVLAATDLPAWEKESSELAICGRGENVPTQIEEIVPTALLTVFHELIEQVIEIGIADMYGADTILPKQHLNNATKILQDYGVRSPEQLRFRIQPRPLKDRWGRPLSPYEYADFVRKILG